MVLAPATRLGPYEILALIGSGGMGEVYRARDTKLKRDVALKVLPDSFTHDFGRLARFQREAEVLASLNHPHIASIHGVEESDGIRALVLEFVDGPTLADRIARGPIPLEEALPIARQIAEALEAAHEHGIIHRDLKPANVKVRADGTVKVLDFGLAKAIDPLSSSPAGPALANSPTITNPAAMTAIGILLGTAAYMSPEQARGKFVDKRADIWAFGCVLFEMLTGTRAFGGDDVTDTLAFIIIKEPSWPALPGNTPRAIQRLLRRCLEKERKKRLADIADAALDIDEALARPDPATPAGRAASTAIGRSRWLLAAAVVLGCALGAAAAWMKAAGWQTPPPPTVRFSMPDESWSTPLSTPAVSHLGDRIALVGFDNGVRVLKLRTLQREREETIAGTAGASSPFWSPDDRWIGFFANGRLKRVQPSGAAVEDICEATFAGASGTWVDEQTILFSSSDGLFRVKGTSGAKTEEMRFSDLAVSDLRAPSALPGATHFLISVLVAGLHVAAVDGSTVRHLNDGRSGQWMAGHLLFSSNGQLIAQPFDAKRLEFTGVPIVVAPVSTTPNAGPEFAAAGNVIVFRPNLATPTELAVLDRAGNRINAIAQPAGDCRNPELSPNGRRLLIECYGPQQNRDIWLVDLARGIPSRFTSDPGDDSDPVWSPDGEWIAFHSKRGQKEGVYRKRAGGAVAEELLYQSSRQIYPMSWSPDGTVIAMNEGLDVVLLPLAGDRKPTPALATRFNEIDAQFSPDGRFIMYTSNESGANEIYVQRFPPNGDQWQISAGGGTDARWRRDGRAIYYLRPDRMLMSVDASLKPQFVAGKPVTLFATRVAGPLGGGHRFPMTPMPDGSRFIVYSDTNPSAEHRLQVIVNWRPPS